MIPELSNSYLTLPPVDQLYTSAPPQQQYSSSAPLGGVPRVAQTSGSGYRYYENMQSMSNWMPQASSHLEPMDSYVRAFLVILCISLTPFLVLSSLIHKTGFPPGHHPPIPSPVDTTNSNSNASLLLLCTSRLSVPFCQAFCCASELYSIIIPVHTYTVRILYLSALLYTVF